MHENNLIEALATLPGETSENVGTIQVSELLQIPCDENVEPSDVRNCVLTANCWEEVV